MHSPNAPPAEAPLLQALAGATVHPPPVWLMRQAGRYLPEYLALRAQAGSFLDLCLTPSLAAEATLQPVRRFGFDAAILFADILLVPYAMGQPLAYVDGEGPKMDPLTSLSDVMQLGPTEQVKERLLPVFKTVARVRKALPSQVAVIGFAGAPWTVATYMIGGGGNLQAALRWASQAPDSYRQLSHRLESATAAYLRRQAESGADVLQLFDSWAGVLTSSQFRQLCIEPTRRVTEELQASHPSLPIIGFPKGASMPDLLAYARDSGVTAVGVDHSVDPRAAARQLQPLVPVQGNLDPDMLTPGRPGLPEAVRQVRQAFANGPHVFNLGHGIRPNADPERVSELVARVRGAE